MDLARDLNPPQLEAVTHGDGPLLVFAGAGSGKTRVITYRIAHLVADRGVRPPRILAVTFTNKAAGEMRHRISDLLGGSTRGLWLGTFHALCARILRLHAADAGIPESFAIFDESDQKSLITRVLRDLGLDEKRTPHRAFLSAIGREKQEDRGVDEVKRPKREALRALPEVYAEYERRKEAAGGLDFDDLLFRTVRLLRSHDDILDAYRDRFLHVLVDEFQDTNGLQYTFLRQVSAKHRAITVVGDDDQSIYSWRGADFRNIARFRDDFPGTHVVKLEQNYRSTGHILDAAGAVISQNRVREPKKLWTAGEAGRPVEVACLIDEREEAVAVVRAIATALEEGLRLSDVAVFYRVHAMSRVIEEALRAADVPYVVVGGMRFYERAEIKDVLAYLRVLANPLDDVSMARIVNVPPRGIGKGTMEAIEAHARAEGISLWVAIERAAAGDVAGVHSRSRKALGEFVGLLGDLRRQVGARPSEIAATVLDRTGYVETLRREDSLQADARIENLEELVGSMQAVEMEDPEIDVTRFLEKVSLSTDLDAVGEGETDRVVLMTVHSAKGLEFERVVVVGLEERLFPYQKFDVSEGSVEDPEKEEEERRLCYVAMTRARERLLLLHTRQRTLFGRVFHNEASRFLFELPEEAVVDVSPVRARPRDLPPRRSPREVEIDYGFSQEVPDVDLPFTVGSRVRHKTFGRGRVKGIVAGVEPKVQVEFEDVGTKLLVARFLEPA